MVNQKNHLKLKLDSLAPVGLRLYGTFNDNGINKRFEILSVNKVENEYFVIVKENSGVSNHSVSKADHDLILTKYRQYLRQTHR